MNEVGFLDHEKDIKTQNFSFSSIKNNMISHLVIFGIMIRFLV